MASNFIPKSFVESLLSRTNLIEIISERIEIKKTGKDCKALCPFHDEKSPSFSISEVKGFYHCFGCGAHGTAVSFVMEYDNLDFISAIKYLAERAGVDIPTEDNESYQKEKALVQLMHEVSKIYQAELEKSQSTIEYLKNRDLSLDTIENFSIGYAPNSWEFLSKHKDLQKFSATMLVEAGLVSKKGNKYYDRFRNRVMFPIRSKTGSIIGFGGRTLDGDKAKYLNSPETIIFSKGDHLYGSYETRPRTSKEDAVYVAEGYLDVIMLAQHDIKPVVATLGTAATFNHLKQLLMMSEKVIFCFDGDEAGKKAALRAAEIALSLAGGLTQFFFLMVPEGEDPDSIVKQSGRDPFLALASKAIPLSELIIKDMESKTTLTTSEGKSKFVELSKSYYKKIKNPIFRATFISAISSQINLSPSLLSDVLKENELSTPLGIQKKEKPISQGPKSKENYFLREAISAVIHFPELAQKNINIELLEQSNISGTVLFSRVIKYIRSSNETSTAQIIEYLRDDDEGKYLARIANDYYYQELEVAEQTFDDILTGLSQKLKRQQIADKLKGRF
jgi:DNA primase